LGLEELEGEEVVEDLEVVGEEVMELTTEEAEEVMEEMADETEEETEATADETEELEPVAEPETDPEAELVQVVVVPAPMVAPPEKEVEPVASLTATLNAVPAGRSTVH